MAKRAIQPDATPPAAPVTVTDVELELAGRVLVSQGHAIGRLGSFPAEIQKALAAFTNQAGEVQPAAVDGVRILLADYFAAQKAIVDEVQ